MAYYDDDRIITLFNLSHHQYKKYTTNTHNLKQKKIFCYSTNIHTYVQKVVLRKTYKNVFEKKSHRLNIDTFRVHYIISINMNLFH